jgi:2',5'-phosphodiesterase
MPSALVTAFSLFFLCNLGCTPQAMTSSLRLRVVSYNLLSSHLATTTQYPTLNPEHLDAKNRLPLVLNKLEKEIQSNQNVILCLQEVSYDWAGSLHTFLANRGYHLVTGSYGKKFNGYMGVCLAWPQDSFVVEDVDISRIADKREGGWPVNEEPPLLQKVWSKLQTALDKPLRKLGLVSGEDIDHWDMSERRFNVLVSATLKEKASGQSFCIGTYHMPCAFYAPMVMTIHTDLAARHVQRLAESHGSIPYILAGDFNIKPSDPCYRLLTTGEIDSTDPYHPSPKGGVEWKPSSINMASAYAVSDHGEPDFTNYSRSRDNEPFIDTLDYIFLDKRWTVNGVLPIGKREESGGPFPNLDKDEPSDHILIAADIELK